MSEERSGLTRDEMRALLEVEEELLVVLEREEIALPDAEGRYPPNAVERVRICHTLHGELGVNPPGLEVALHLLERIAAERRQFRETLEWLGRRMSGQKR